MEATSDKRLQQAAAALAAGAVGPGAAAQAMVAAAAVPSPAPFDYRYGWSFFAAIAAFIMAELAALFSISAYLRRFPTVEDMVREMVPGAERKLREHQRLSSEYLVRHKGPSRRPTPRREVPAAAPDICTTNKSAGIISVMMDQEFPMPQSFAGQTVPITIKSSGGGRSRPGGGVKYGTLPHRPAAAQPGAALRGATLQHPRPGKKSVTIGTFQTMDTGYPEFARRNSSSGYPGSAV